MRVVVDTNVFVSGVFFTGPPHKILQAWNAGRLELAATPEILDEYAEVARRLGSRFARIDLEPILAHVNKRVRLFEPADLGKQICEDPDDDMFLACAIASACCTIVSGDKHLLRVAGYAGVSVLRPRAFVDRFLASR